MVFWESEIAGSQLLWSFDERSAKASFNMELDMAMEEPDTWICQYTVRYVRTVAPTGIICSESNHSVTFVLNHDSVSPDRRGW
jgi:hypothetical protein